MWSLSVGTYRRQSDACNADITESFSPGFQKCQEKLTDVLGFNSNIPDSEVIQFCREHCGTVVIALSKKLAVDCGIPDAKVLDNVLYIQ